MPFQLELIQDPAQLDRLATAWNTLADQNLMLRWEWLGPWWRQFAARRELFVVAVREGADYIGFAPWYAEVSRWNTRTLHFLGDGKTCSDHLSLLCAPSRDHEVAVALGDWLAAASQSDSRHMRWDHLEWTGIDACDRPVNRLVDTLRAAGCLVHRRPGTPCYSIPLPGTWDDYVARRSKTGRRACRQSIRLLDAGTVCVHRSQAGSSLRVLWEQFMALHQRRRHALGSTGCFDFPGLSEFLWNAAQAMHHAGLLRLHVAYKCGVPIAAVFGLQSRDRFYYYQSGMDPAFEADRPGQLLLADTVRQCIADGVGTFDMLRGDEEYKVRWLGQPLETQEVRVAAARPWPRWRQSVRVAGSAMKAWARQSRPPAPQHSVSAGTP